MEEIRLELPPKTFSGQRTNNLIIEKNNNPNPERIKEDEEDVDLEAIDDSLPENNNQIQSYSPPQKPLKEMVGNIESEFNFFNNFDLDKDDDNKIDEDTLLGKMIARDIIRTDIPSYLLSEELTFLPKMWQVS